MKRITFLKTIALAAAMMLGGASSAWADPTTIYERKVTDGSLSASTSATQVSALWSTNDIYNSSVDATTGGWTGDTGNTSIDAMNGLKISVASNKGEKSISKTLAISSNVILTVDAVLYDPTSSNQSTSNYCYFQIGSGLRFRYSYRGANIQLIADGDTKHTVGSLTRGNNWAIHAVINTVENKITALTVAGTDILAALSVSYISLADLSTYTQLSLGTYSANYDNAFCLKEVTVQQEIQAVATYGYTVNYKVGETLVKQVVVENGGVGARTEGSNIPVLSAFNGDDRTGNGGEDYSGKRYVLVADAPVQTVTTTAANNVLDVSVREKYSTTMTVTRYFDGVAEETPFINAQELTETDDKDNSWTYVFPYYVQNNAKWYRATLKGASNEYGATGTFTTVAISQRVDYTLDEDVVFYSEHGSGTDINYSNGGYDAYWKTQSIGSLDAGTYEMTAMQEAGQGCTLYNGWVNSDNKGTALIPFSDSNRTDYFTLTENTTSLQLHNGSNARMDYILIRRITSVSISDCDNLGYTFSSKLPLNFTGKNVEAYTAAYNSTTKKVELSRVYKVPANTGLFIKGSADDIPVLTGDADVMGTNNLIAVSATTTVNQTAGDYTNFVLGVDDASAPTAAVFLKVPSAGVSVSAGKAYLQIPTASVPATARMAVVFNDETTGISHIENGALRMDNSVYNLSGQRVSQPKKGLYIVNGKKVIIK